MAIEVTLVPELTPEVTAAVNLSTHKDKVVQITATGVQLADVRSAAYTGTGVLKNDPQSGEACTVGFGPSVQKCIAGEAITRGQYVQPMSASGLVGVTSGGNPAAIGFAWSTAAGSGEYLGVKFTR